MIGVELLLLAPAVTAVLCFLLPDGKLRSSVSIIGSAATLAVAVPLCYDVFAGNTVEYSLWFVDRLSAMFVILTAVIGFLVSMYSHGYVSKDREEGVLTNKGERNYLALFHLFVVFMLVVCVVNSVGILWIAIEATTLVSAFLVGIYNKEGSTEAAWKYLMICSVGITLALVGITLVYASSVSVPGVEGSSALDWSVLYAAASSLDPALLKVAFVFILVGFGTKMGLVPMHTWLPDAHSQAPTPISAMMSAVLLNCALYSVIRFQMIVDIAVPGYTKFLMIGFGILSLLVAAAFILISKNIKRMLAYSSIEHMGLIAIGFGIGTSLAVFGALFHVIAHSLSKSFIFMSAGNVIQEYGTNDMNEIRGMRERMPFTSFMMIASAFAITGLPPFAVFVGELSILRGSLDAGMYILTAAIVILIVMVFAGFMRKIFPMLGGTTEKEVREPSGIMRKLPLAILLVTTVFMGLFMPEQIKDVLEAIASLAAGGMP